MKVDASSKTSKKGADRPPPNAGNGRPKGAVNKTTKALKDAILLAAEKVGLDGKGKDGLTGYLVGLAKTEPKAFSSLLGRVLPLTIAGSGPNGEIVTRRAADLTDDQLAAIAAGKPISDAVT